MAVTLEHALRHALGPLTRLLIRHGVSFDAFMALVKQSYVEVADAGSTRTPLSRIAAMTGINRREVKRVLERAAGTPAGQSDHDDRIARIVAGWQQDEEFTDDERRPRALVFGGVSAEFNRLVRRYGGEVSARAVLDALESSGVALRRDSSIELLAPPSLPHPIEQERLERVGESMHDLIATLEYNLAGGQPPRLELSIAYDNLTDEGIAVLEAMVNERAPDLLDALDSRVARHDRDLQPGGSGPNAARERRRVGLGIYYIGE